MSWQNYLKGNTMSSCKNRFKEEMTENFIDNWDACEGAFIVFKIANKPLHMTGFMDKKCNAFTEDEFRSIFGIFEEAFEEKDEKDIAKRLV